MPDPPQSAPPVVFDIPVVGYPVHLGELYNQRTGKFLGVGLYPPDKIEPEETNINNTELNVSLSTTHEEKATVLDINARLSLSILGGLIKVSGSAHYLNDEKSNTQQYAYAMSLNMRLTEKRLLFAEDKLGRNVVPLVLEDYIKDGPATHFVSSIVYGGCFIINLVARQSSYSQEELIEGALQAQLDKLKGAIDLKGEASVEIKDEFKDMNDKFDLILHGDVTLEKVPNNPQDVLDTFPDAASLIKEDGGVPISVTLQPIPAELVKTAIIIYELDAEIVDVILTAFANIDDLLKRFAVLRESVKKLQDFVPELVHTIRDADTEYIIKHTELVRNLGTLLIDYQHGERPDYGQLLEEVTTLYTKHLKPDLKDPDASKQYPTNLVGLENAFSRFENFISTIKIEKKALKNPTRPPTYNEGVEGLFHLSSLKEVSGVIGLQEKIPLFIMTPISGDESSPNIAFLKFLAIVRKYDGYFDDSANPAYLLYAENLGTVADSLPNGEEVSRLKEPALFLGTLDEWGGMTWDSSPPVTSAPPPDIAFPVHFSVLGDGNFDHFSLNTNPLNATKAYSIQIRVEATGTPGSVILLLELAGKASPFLSFRSGLVVFDETKHKIMLQSSKVPKPNDRFLGTFVQDIERKEQVLYFNSDVVARKQITEGDIVPQATHLQIGFPKRVPKDDMLLGFNGFTRALDAEEVKACYTAWRLNELGISEEM